MMPGLSCLGGMFAGGDTTPDAANWGPVGDGTSSFGINAVIAVTGINERIQVRVESSSGASYDSGNGNVACMVNGVSEGVVNIVAADTADFWIDPADEINFSASGHGGSSWTTSCTVTVKYKSPGSVTFDVTWDTFAVDLSFPL